MTHLPAEYEGLRHLLWGGDTWETKLEMTALAELLERFSLQASEVSSAMRPHLEAWGAQVAPLGEHISSLEYGKAQDALRDIRQHLTGPKASP